jgi:membrane-associated phospholipid phosphatase
MTTPSGGTGTPSAGGAAPGEDRENAILLGRVEAVGAPEDPRPVEVTAEAAEPPRPGEQVAAVEAAEAAEAPRDQRPGEQVATTEQARARAVEAVGQAEALAAQAAERARAVHAEATETAPGAAAARATEKAQEVAAAETLPRRVAVERGRGVLAVAVAGVLGFGLIFTIVRMRRTVHFDLAVTRALQRLPVLGLPQLMGVVSWPGFPPQSRIIPFVLSGTIAWLGFPLEALFQFLGWGTGLISTVTKALMKRPRPLEPDVRVVTARLGGSSFPSGHVITYMGVYGFLAYLVHTLVRPVRIRRTAVGFLTGLLALVGPSRIYQGHHWATDVIASYMLGLSYLIGLSAVYRRLKGSLHPRLSDPPRS